MFVDIETVLNYIDGSDYDTWKDVGMICQAAGFSESVWKEWSRHQDKYKTGECEKKWQSFHGDGGLGVGTLIKMARDGGMPNDYVLSDGKRTGKLVPTRPAVPPVEWAFEDDYTEDTKCQYRYPRYFQLYMYLRTLYKPDDVIGVSTAKHTRWNGEKYYPEGGERKRVGDILDALKTTRDISAAVGDSINPNAGAWIYLNTYGEKDDRRFTNNNVAKYSYALVECDKIPPEDQERKYKELNLPIIALVSSGGRSIHAVVRIDAKDLKEFQTRVSAMYAYLKEHGLEIDPQVSNPARMSRMPGVMRGTEEQALIALNIGAGSWNEWAEQINAKADEKKHKDFVFDVPADEINPPELKPELIVGLLRKGGKMVITGAPKSGKSFFAVELGLSIAFKPKFLDFEIKESQRVLYINLENERGESNNRTFFIKQSMGIKRDPDARFVSVTLMGETYNTEELVDEIERQCAGMGFGVIIIDPIYKIMDGDENKAGDVTRMLNQFDRLRKDMDCAVIYTHHHSKGSQGQKDAMDRGSGSGVISRDFDALIDITRLEVDPDFLEEKKHGGASAWHVEYVARSFKNPEPQNMFFEYPVHNLDNDGILDEAVVKGSPEYEAKTKAQATSEWQMRQKEITWDLRQQRIAAAWDRIGKDRVKKSELIDMIFEGIDPEAKIAEWRKVSWNTRLGDVCKGKSDYRLEDGYVVKNVKN